MIFDWFNAREAEKIASDLADQFAPKAPPQRGPQAMRPTRTTTRLCRTCFGVWIPIGGS